MDLQEQLKKLFPEHQTEQVKQVNDVKFWMQDQPLVCKYEKRKGKPITIIEGYNGTSDDFKALAKEIKTSLRVGGSFKNDTIIIQGNYRDKIMDLLKENGFQVKRSGG